MHPPTMVLPVVAREMPVLVPTLDGRWPRQYDNHSLTFSTMKRCCCHFFGKFIIFVTYITFHPVFQR